MSTDAGGPESVPVYAGAPDADDPTVSPDKEREGWWTLIIDSVAAERGSRTDRELGELIQAQLAAAGYEVVQTEVAPDWAERLLDTLFTGKRLDFDGGPIPLWLARRLEAEFGMPLPQVAPTAGRPAMPVDLDDEQPGLGIVHDRTLD